MATATAVVRDEALARDGFTLLERVIPEDLGARLRARIEALYAQEGEQAGEEFKTEPAARRLANLANKGEVFLEAMTFPPVLAAVRTVLGPDAKLSSLNARLVEARSGEYQPLHCDMGSLPDARGAWTCNTIWMLDEFTAENGAVRCVPGSHASGRLPEQVLDDARAPHPDEVLVTGPAGSVTVMNAHLWHGGTPNRSARPRLALHAFYCRRDKPQQFWQKPAIAPEVAAALTPEQRWLLALDDPQNDVLSRDVARRSGFMR